MYNIWYLRGFIFFKNSVLLMIHVTLFLLNKCDIFLLVAAKVLLEQWDSMSTNIFKDDPWYKVMLRCKDIYIS